MTTILVAEDDPGVRTMLAVLLERAGYSVMAVGGGHECLDALSGQAIDLVVLDVEMPYLDGWDTLTAIRSTSTIPVVLLTALSGDEHRARSVDRGADGFVTKPFINRELLDTIGGLVDKPDAAS